MIDDSEIRRTLGAQKRSRSALYLKSRGKDLVWYLQVKGYGVLVLRTGSDLTDARGRVVPERAAALEIGDIGHSPVL